MTPSQVAIRAAQLISQRGLTKGKHEDEEGALCHNGAVYMAVAEDKEASDKQLALEVIGRSALVVQRQHPDLQQPHQLNDLPETSAEDIILLLKENAALDDDPEALEIIAQRRADGQYTLGTSISFGSFVISPSLIFTGPIFTPMPNPFISSITPIPDADIHIIED